VTSERRSALALGASFFLLYAGLGLTLHLRAPRLFTQLDLVFDADVPSRIIDLTRVGGAHYRTQLHPLFVLLLNPLGLLLRGALRTLGAEPSGRLAAIVLTAAAGATAVALFFLWLRRVSALRTSGLWALLFGLSSSQMVFGTLPETFGFSSLSLVAAFLVIADAGRPLALRLAASVACFGMALSNLGAVFLTRADGLWRSGRKIALASAAWLALITVAVSAPLAALQLWIYPRSVPFYVWAGVAQDDHASVYRPTSTREALARARDLGAHLFLFNLAAPRLEVQGSGTERPTVDFPVASWRALRPAGGLHLAPWAFLLGAAVLGLFASRGVWKAPVRAASLWLATNAALHSVFGESLFLYSGQWTFAVVALAALGTEAWAGVDRARGLVVLSALAMAVGLQAVANLALFADLLSVFS
jgi:hypothetical protein